MSNDISSSDDNILELLFEPDNAEILTQLRNESKTALELEKFVDKVRLDQSLSFLIKNGFVKKTEKNEDILYSIDTDHLSKVLENQENFQNIDNGLAKLDSFLNWFFKYNIKFIQKCNFFFTQSINTKKLFVVIRYGY